jgi:hypothetical protein
VTLAESPAKEPVNIAAITKPAAMQSLTIEDRCIIQNYLCEIRASQIDSTQIRTTEIGIDEDCLTQTRFTQVRLAQVSFR